MAKKTLEVQYFAVLRERRGLSREQVSTSAGNSRELYDELQARHGFDLPAQVLRVAVNEEFRSWESPLKDGDRVAFIQPVAGG